MKIEYLRVKGTWQIVESKQAEVRPLLPKELSNIHSDLLPPPKFSSASEKKRKSESSITLVQKFSSFSWKGETITIYSGKVQTLSQSDTPPLLDYKTTKIPFLMLIKCCRYFLITHQMSNSAFLSITLLLGSNEILHLDCQQKYLLHVCLFWRSVLIVGLDCTPEKRIKFTLLG